MDSRVLTTVISRWLGFGQRKDFDQRLGGSYYGSCMDDEILDEDSSQAPTFMSEVCISLEMSKKAARWG